MSQVLKTCVTVSGLRKMLAVSVTRSERVEERHGCLTHYREMTQVVEDFEQSYLTKEEDLDE